jgi:hypothetical protein
MRRIEIHAGAASATATLAHNDTADAVWQVLPFEGQANRWGDEIYFEIPVEQPQAGDAREEVAPGELGYWPLGRAFCIFWGPTPASRAGEPRAYSPVNVFGKLDGDPAVFDGIQGGTPVRVERSRGGGA